ncbi:MAG: hypothetical protein K8R88_15590, partial [Armatimonadetes bacterium]|nr:hypothetical protein [Armatimonadota bacterium]
MSQSITSGIAAALLAVATNAHIKNTIQEVPDEKPAVVEKPTALNSFNPQISLVSDFRSRLVNSKKGDEKLTEMKELELGFAADVDPFLKAEAYIAFAREDGKSVAEVEEAFARYTRLGKGLSAKFGKIAGAIGHVQRNHTDQLNWLDYPLVIQDFLGGEGLRAPGGSLSYLAPGDRFHEFSLEALTPDDGPLFSGSDSGKPVMIGHYRTFHDFSEDLSAQFGASYANGPGANNGRGSMMGLDMTMKLQPSGTGRSLMLESEAYWGKPGGPGQKTAFGAFAAATYQIAPRIFGTLKVDRSEVPGTNNRHSELSLGLTLRPTEFHYWRVQFKQRTSNFGDSRNTLD